MLSPRWHKVLRDIWVNKSRTILVVLSIAVGIFALGCIMTARLIFSHDLGISYRAIDPASASLYSDPFDDNLVQAVRGMKEIREAEGRRSFTVRINVGPDKWENLQLFAIPDYNDIRINKVSPEGGKWPPPEHQLLLERDSVNLTRAGVGQTILIKTPSGKERRMRVAGLAHDLNQFPTNLSGTAYGYITFDTLKWLGMPRDYDQMHIIVAGNSGDKVYVQQIANSVQKKIEKSGRTVYYTWVPTPGKHPSEDYIQPFLMVLGVLGFFSLCLSGFLVVNTITALLAQHVRQIGIMKAIGGRAQQVMAMYFGVVVIYGLLALTVAVPLGAAAGHALAGYLARMVNYDSGPFRIPFSIFTLEAAIGLLIPLLASLYPVIVGTRITVREAVSDYGLSGHRVGQGVIDRMLDRIRFLPRPLLLAMHNTFRRKGRLVLTLVTLSLAGAIFIGVFGVRASLALTLENALNYWNYDIQVEFSQPYRIEQIKYESLRVPGVVNGECWGFGSVRRVRTDGSESGNTFMVAPPIPTKMLRPTVLEGRWLLPEDENAVVLNTDFLKDEPNVVVGQDIVLKMENRETNWRVVGLVRGVMSGPIIYANYPYYARAVREVGKASSVMVVAPQHDGDSQARVAKALEEHFKRIGMRVSSTETIATVRSQIKKQFNMIIVFLLIMAALLAVTGGLGLAGTMSINVLERTREIGVMRAIGASNTSLLQVFMVEGIFIGFLSWLIGALLALPLSKFLTLLVGGAMRLPLSYAFSVTGLLFWLVLSITLAAASSYLPSRRASRLSVREVLAYQ